MPSPSPYGKWLPTYELRVETAPGATFIAPQLPKTSLVTKNASGGSINTVVIQPPLTLDFVVDRAYQAQTQTGNFKIRNLSPNLRNLLYKDPFDTHTFRAVQLRAGYPGYMPLIFNGNLMTGKSYRASGETDIITELDCVDGQYQQQNAFAPNGASFAGGAGAYSYAQIMNSLALTLPFTYGQPIIGKFPTVPVRGLALGGNTWNIIGQLGNGLQCLDNGQFKCLNENEVFNALIPVLNADSGLLGSPTRTQSTIECEFMFEPRLTLGQIVELQSTTNSIFNGPYKVMGFTHRGTISRAVDGERRTTIMLWRAPAALEVVQGNAFFG